MRIEREKYTSHISDLDKKELMKRIIDKAEKVLNSHTIESTDFLDPYESILAKSFLNGLHDLKYMEDGGLKDAERKIILIFPSYMEVENLEKRLLFLRAKGDFQSLSHKDFLGALLSMGIKREKSGDIIVHDNFADFILKADVGGFVLINLQKIGNQNIQMAEIQREELSEQIVKFDEVGRFVSSLRLDVFLSAVYNISRTEALNIIKSNNVKVNWEPIGKPSLLLSQGDIISTRGFGRAIIHSIDGLSKKGRTHVNIRIPI